MENNNSETRLGPAILQNIRFNARKLGRAVPGMGVEDIEQDIILDLLRRSKSFDPRRASFRTFADRVVGHRASTLRKPTLRSWAEGSWLSLDTPAGSIDGVRQSLADAIADPAPPLEDQSAIRLDVRRFVADLPDNLVTGCKILLADTVSSGAEEAGINRSTAYDWIKRVRDRAIGGGLSIYRNDPDASRASRVSGQEGPDTKQASCRPGSTGTMMMTSVGYRSRLLLTEADFENWLRTAECNQKLEYHRGFLSLDIASETGRLPISDQSELTRLARRVRSASDQGLVHLMQRRHGTCDYSYIAIVRGQNGDSHG